MAESDEVIVCSNGECRVRKLCKYGLAFEAQVASGANVVSHCYNRGSDSNCTQFWPSKQLEAEDQLHKAHSRQTGDKAWRHSSYGRKGKFRHVKTGIPGK